MTSFSNNAVDPEGVNGPAELTYAPPPRPRYRFVTWYNGVLFGLMFLAMGIGTWPTVLAWMGRELSPVFVVMIGVSLLLFLLSMLWACWVWPVVCEVVVLPTRPPREDVRLLRFAAYLPMFILLGGVIIMLGMVGLDWWEERPRSEWVFGWRAFIVPVLLTLITGYFGWIATAKLTQKRRLETFAQQHCYECGYDLHMSIQAGNTHCPECGTRIGVIGPRV